METRTVSVVKHPLEVVWSAMRDRLPEIAAGVEDVARVELKHRGEREDGSVEVEYVWHACPKIPAVIANHVRPEMLRWEDRALWRAHDHTCTWEIEPHAFAETIQCHGSPSYEPAMGGRGTRITFTNNFAVVRQLENPLLAIAEPLLRGLIPKNFQKVVGSLATLLDKSTA
ncbi:MAG TPA: hypothetical protein VG095_00250 [Chthoniobacterales bacterium]|nr:hypothetical protein [Chthoniobacterales bacterium]